MLLTMAEVGLVRFARVVWMWLSAQGRIGWLKPAYTRQP
jgi:hypothetical protein